MYSNKLLSVWCVLWYYLLIGLHWVGTNGYHWVGTIGWVPLGGYHWVGTTGWVPLGGYHWVGTIGWVPLGTITMDARLGPYDTDCLGCLQLLLMYSLYSRLLQTEQDL